MTAAPALSGRHLRRRLAHISFTRGCDWLERGETEPPERPENPHDESFRFVCISWRLAALWSDSSALLTNKQKSKKILATCRDPRDASQALTWVCRYQKDPKQMFRRGKKGRVVKYTQALCCHTRKKRLKFQLDHFLVRSKNEAKRNKENRTSSLQHLFTQLRKIHFSNSRIMILTEHNVTDSAQPAQDISIFQVKIEQTSRWALLMSCLVQMSWKKVSQE